VWPGAKAIKEYKYLLKVHRQAYAQRAWQNKKANGLLVKPMIEDGKLTYY